MFTANFFLKIYIFGTMSMSQAESIVITKIVVIYMINKLCSAEDGLW